MAPRTFRGPGLMGWLANEAEWRKRERRRQEANRNQFSDRRPAATPKPKPQPWTQQQIDRLSSAVQRIGARNGLSFNGTPPPRPQPAGSPQPPRPAASNNSGSGSGSGRGSNSSPTRRPASSLKINKPTAPKPNIGPVADGEAYARSKDPKKYNPLMQKTFGYQTGGAPDQRAARSKTTGVGPVADGKAYSDSLKVKPKPTESVQDKIRKRRQGR